jgi:hypothetical protein
VVHLQENGFEVETRQVTDAQLVEAKRRHGVPASLDECHTGVIDGYAIEGHVPADVLKQFLSEKPAVAGLVVPDMPPGSPGMESPNPVPYNVLTFTKDGRTAVYARR